MYESSKIKDREGRKGFQNAFKMGAKLDAKTHQRSMQNQVARNIRKIMKSRVFRCVKPCKNTIRSSKNEVWQGECAGLENHQTNIKNNVKIRPKISGKSM